MRNSILQTIHRSSKLHDNNLTAKERIELRELESKGLVRVERKANDNNIYWTLTRKAKDDL
jgi:hypothetical protein